MTRLEARFPGWLVCSLCGFVAGCAAVLLFHQSLWGLFYLVGASPVAPYLVQPIPPFGVPRIVSQTFWGGVWGLLLAPLVWRREGLAYWLTAAGFGLIILTLTGVYLVPVLKGLPLGAFRTMDQVPLIIQIMRPLLNLVWGLGTALLLELAKRAIAKRA
jgi:hypothetical protein